MWWMLLGFILVRLHLMAAGLVRWVWAPLRPLAYVVALPAAIALCLFWMSVAGMALQVAFALATGQLVLITG